MERVFIVGNNGREAATATLLAEQGESELHIASQYVNPGFIADAERTGGRLHLVRSVSDTEALAEVAVEAKADVVWINQDDALANNAAGLIKQRLPDAIIASPDREGARIEWDNFDCREIVAEIDAEYGTNFNPLYFTATRPEEVDAAIDFFDSEGIEIVVKPRGLTGGKGVKVMGKHFTTFQAGKDYAKKIINDPKQGGVVIEERLEGEEFNIQGLTAGRTLIKVRETFDYPYRLDGNLGPGTGGMGSFMMPDGQRLPFVSEQIYDQATWLMEKVLEKLEQRGRDYKGTLYASFFMTPKGLKLVEFNARMGCPEGMNVIEQIDDDVSLLNIIRRIGTQQLRPQDVRYRTGASTAIYFVSPDYAYDDRPERVYRFELDEARIAAMGCRTYFAAAEQIGIDTYRTAGPSRTVALAARAPTPWEARAMILAAHKEGVRGLLDYRREVAEENFVRNLRAV